MSSVIIVRDIFEELIEENKRLLNDIKFANECLLKLIDLKSFVELIFGKIEYNLEENDFQKYYKLNGEVNEVLQRRQDINNFEQQ